MTKLTTARDDAAKKFIASIEEVYRSALDRETEAGKLAALRARCREVAGIQCERLLGIAQECRQEDYNAIQGQLLKLVDQVPVLNDALMAAKANAVKIMTELYGANGEVFAMGRPSAPETAAQAEFNTLQEIIRQKEKEGAALMAHIDNGTQAEYRLAPLLGLDPVNTAFYAKAYLAAAVAGELVA